MRHLTLLAAVAALALAAAPAFAGKGNGNGNNREPNGSCTVDGNVVRGTNLPNWELMNFMVTDSTGTTGWVLGYTDNGTWNESVPNRDGSTTYEFASKTWGPNGSKYEVFASCSA